ncbi:hypothetical protein [Lentilactobacillus kosonis]|uniref:Uncharacterized protein n=1 Tax=Lentilactobacillus kosonis TaxID=2810561 RepID=A0A401FPR4_9LACO|nr:hypothetical protein [Lentilactobacillus kosonis]GAY74380.1 hypothetical protein NBRC111893_2526 [Lentilactobacillus kosonis]
MAKAEFTDQLQKLRSGEISEIKVQPTEFMDFQEAFMDFEARKRVIGTAQKGGIVVYTFEKAQSE